MVAARRDMLAQLEAAYKAATVEVAPSLYDIRKTIKNHDRAIEALEKAVEKVGYVTIDVKGDGKFKILNAKGRQTPILITSRVTDSVV